TATVSVRSLLLGLCASFFALGESSAQVQPRATNQAPSGVPATSRISGPSAPRGPAGRTISQLEDAPASETEGSAAPIEPEQSMGEEPASEAESADWTKNSNARIFPRPGNFFILPSGPGYYSLMDQVQGIRREKAPQSAYPAFAIMAPGFFDADFRYLDEKPDDEKLPYERLKRIRLGKNFLFSTGGETWYRYNDFNNLTPVTNVYGLTKVRAYGDLWYRDQLRLYAEFIDADRGGWTLPPAPTDIDRADMLDLFVDVKLGEIKKYPVYVRGGRQEVLLGSQRLISTLPWANMRRNFDGVRGFRQGEKFDVDLFWLRPVIPNANKFDSSDPNQQLAGAWFTYRPKKGHFLDFYYLYYNNSNRVVQQGIVVDPTRFSTLGTRYAGDRNNYLWDFEYALQLGRHQSQGLVAGMATTGVGYHWAKQAWNPTLWLYYDYASGSSNPNGSMYTTFNQLFPFGHYYLGWADVAGRQNINDVNLHPGPLSGELDHDLVAVPPSLAEPAARGALQRRRRGGAARSVGRRRHERGRRSRPGDEFSPHHDIGLHSCLCATVRRGLFAGHLHRHEIIVARGGLCHVQLPLVNRALSGLNFRVGRLRRAARVSVPVVHYREAHASRSPVRPLAGLPGRSDSLAG
ncbi:MAG: alginate export family protein, partial [Pirellulales bacterium]